MKIIGSKIEELTMANHINIGINEVLSPIMF